jgi:hypothetical protein
MREIFTSKGKWIRLSEKKMRPRPYFENQPLDFPRSKARGLLRVDTDRRDSPCPIRMGLAPPKYQGED